VRIHEENPGLKQLEEAVEAVNDGQKRLDRIRMMENSLLYRGCVRAWDTISGLFGKKPARIGIYELFRVQQGNVRELNYVLAAMVAAYGKDVEKTRGELDSLVEKVTDETLRRRVLDVEIPPEVESYEGALAALEGIDKEKEPEKYYSALQKVIDLKRGTRRRRFEYGITSMGQHHHKMQVDNLMLQEELFETMLYRVMDMAFNTELYQQTLDSNARIWSSIHTLSEAVARVSKGIGLLADFNQQLNASYLGAVRDIVQIIDAHPGRKALEATNKDLGLLVEDVNASSYRQAIEHEGA
jgi:hypothetical protein